MACEADNFAKVVEAVPKLIELGFMGELPHP